MKDYQPQELPPSQDLETVAVLKACSRAHRYLAELKGLVSSIPQPGLLVSTLGLQEAKDSSEVENIITTSDDLFKPSMESK